MLRATNDMVLQDAKIPTTTFVAAAVPSTLFTTGSSSAKSSAMSAAQAAASLALNAATYARVKSFILASCVGGHRSSSRPGAASCHPNDHIGADACRLDQLGIALVGAQ